MLFKGVIIRFIGLEFREASPDNVVAKFCPDRIPEIRRVVVPLFPTFKVEAGALSPRNPLPCTRMQDGFFSISTPILRKQSMVDRQSAPSRKCVISVVPSAMEPNIIER